MSSRFLACTLLVLSALSLRAQIGVLTHHDDNTRSGVYPAETLLAPGNVNSSNFGKLFAITVDGKVDAEPLYVPAVSFPGQGTRNALYVATEHDSVFALDADTGTTLWTVSLLGPGETTSDDRGCSQVTPEIGITSTPVIDPASGPHGAIYVVGMSKLTNSSGTTYFQRLHALDLTTGAELFNGPVDIQATFPGTGDNSANGTVVFDPKQYEERAGLLLLNGFVYTAWTSHCDIRPYTGWVMGYDKATLRQVAILDLVPNGQEGAVWQAGSGIAADSSGNIFLIAGNGTFDTTLTASGLPSLGDYGNAFIKISTSGGALTPVNYFATFDTVSQSVHDSDFGSGGALVLPDLNDSQGHVRHLAVGAGKDSNIYLLDRDNMGKFNPNSNAQIYQELSGALAGSVFSMPAFLGSTLYYGAVGDNLKAFSYVNGAFAAPAQSKSPGTFAYPGTTPSISANRTANAIVWAAENSSTAVLHAYDAGNLSNELYNSNQAANSRDHFGSGNKFITPLIANGKVYVGTTNGVGVFGLLSCHYSLSATNISAPPAGASGTLAVNSGAGCQWSSYNNSGFVSLGSPSAGSGSANIPYTIAPNSGPARTTMLAIAGKTVIVSQAAAGSAAPVPRDFRGIGRSDVLTYDPVSGTAYVGLSSGTGTFTYVYSLFSPGFDVLRTADVNGDGKADLVLYNSQTGVGYIGMSNGDGTFAFQPLSWGPGYKIVESGDINGDGKADFVLYNATTGTLYSAVGNGTGGFTYKYTLISQGYTSVRLADFSGDGIADLFLYDAVTGASYFGAGDGFGGFSFHPLDISPGYDFTDSGDLNGDGKTDIILYNSANGNAATGISNGSGGFTFTSLFFSPGFTSVRLADYSGDGKADVTLYDKNNGAAYFGSVDGNGKFTFQSLFWSPDYDWVVPQDVNGDGKSDIVLYNSATGTSYTGIGNGSGGFSYTYALWGPGKVLAQ